MSGDITTPNLGLVKPAVGGSPDTWGDKENTNADAIDGWAGTVGSRLLTLENTVASLQGQIAALAEAIGTVKFWLSDAKPVPGTWVRCDGTWYSASQFPTCFALLGFAWGGDGSTAFAVPDLRGCVLVGLDRGSGRLQGVYGGDRWGAIGGEAIHALSLGEMPVHNHSGTTDDQGDHTHSVTATQFSSSGNWVQGGAGTVLGTFTLTTDANGAHEHNFVTTAAGGGGGHNNCQVGALGDWIIRLA